MTKFFYNLLKYSTNSIVLIVKAIPRKHFSPLQKNLKCMFGFSFQNSIIMDGHNVLRSKLCVVCCSLANRQLSNDLEIVVRDYLIIGYSVNLFHLPSGVCQSCRCVMFANNHSNDDFK